MADPKSTPIDTDNQLIQTEAALRRANRDQLDAGKLLEREQTPAPCGFWRKLRNQCNAGAGHESEEDRR